MTEEDARRWFVDRFGAVAADRIATFLDAVLTENAVQNLISPVTAGAIWARHAVDSAQLLALAPREWQRWLDIGTGGGFPGMIVALLEPTRSVTMVEPRTKRAAFLDRCVTTAGLTEAAVEARKVEAVSVDADVITARAVAAPDQLLRSAAHCANADTTWLLPRGRSATELPSASAMMFHVEHSITDPASIICVGKGCPK